MNGSITGKLGREDWTDTLQLETVNGSMTLRRGARINGHLQNVNGSMTVEGAEVTGELQTVNGDVLLEQGSRVGGIYIEKPGHNSTWFGTEPRNPKVKIEQGAVVQSLRFEREVDLYVAAGVTLPQVQGVAPRKYQLK